MSFHPQTPQSPSQYSPSTSDPNASMSSMSTAITTALPTPAHSVNGSSIPSEMAHENSNSTPVPDDLSSQHKRKRLLDDNGDQGEQKKVQIEDRRMGIENLHLDVGEKYLLCNTPHLTNSVSCSEDLFERFGLTGLAGEVARVLPNGEKNSLRKTYKGHIKKLGVNGHFDSVKQEWDRSDGLVPMMRYPHDEWMVHQVINKEVENGFSKETKGRLENALAFGKGVIPKAVWDWSVLGELAPGNRADKSGSARPTAPNTPLAPSGAASGPSVPRARSQQVPLLAQAQAQAQAQEALRPKRTGTKRSYGDSSFEGYGEGFPDDDLQGSGYSTGDGEMGAAGQKRRKKNTPSGSYSQVRQSSYGPGMVGA